MKILGIILNIASLILIAYLAITKGAPKGEELVLIGTLVAANIVSLILIVKITADSTFLGLYMQRKRLEELQKIDQIKAKK